MRPRLIKRVALLALVACFGVASCGQKGNLYLPNQKKKVPTTAPQPDTPPSPASPPPAPPATQPDLPSAPDSH